MLEPAFHLAAMDERRANIHVLAFSTELQGAAWADPEAGLRYCRMMNDRMPEWVAQVPQRFVDSIVLPSGICDLRCSQHGFKIVDAPASVKGMQSRRFLFRRISVAAGIAH